MQKIAIPILGQKLSQHFATSLLFDIFVVEDKTIIKENLMHVSSQLSESLPVWLARNGVTDIITRKIENKDINLLNRHKINVFVGVKLEYPKYLVQEYIDGTLETNDKLIVH